METPGQFSVSVVIPVFNASEFLTEAVNSVVTLNEVGEVLLIEDGSTDNSLAICEMLANKWKRVRVLRHASGRNAGASASRNLGISAARFDWIQFLDADDELTPDKLRSNWEVISRSATTELVVGNYIYRNGSIETRHAAYKNPWLGLINRALGNTCCNLWRRDLLVRIGGWNEKLSSSQEYDLLFRVLQTGAKISWDESFHTIIIRRLNSITTAAGRRDTNALNRIQLRTQIYYYLKGANMLTLPRAVAIHGYIAKNIGYLDRADKVEFKLNPILVLMYRIWMKVRPI